MSAHYSDREDLEDAVVGYCVESHRWPTDVVDCYIRLRENPRELERVVGWSGQEVLEVLDGILVGAVRELVDSCRELRGWARWGCVDLVAEYLWSRRERLGKYIGSVVDEAIAELKAMVRQRGR